MRCFIAINIPEEIKNNIEKITKELSDPGIKKVAKENLHITLKFLGNVSEDKMDVIKQVLDKIMYKKFGVSLKDIKFFPNPNFIRVVWIGIEKGREEIINLQKQIDSELGELGFKRERNFEPHLTIARVKFLKNKRDFMKKMGSLKIEGCFPISEFCLMQSFLNQKGPTYKKIFEFKLM